MVDVVTEPKFTLDGEEASIPWPAPLPLTAIDEKDVYLLPFFALVDAVIEIEPENVPDVAGANVTEKPIDWPGASEADAANPDTVNPCGTLIWAMLTVVLLLFETRAVCEAVVPITMVPKFMDEGVTEICTADVGDENLVAACDRGKPAAVIATRTNTQRLLRKHRGPRTFIGNLNG